MHPKVRVLVKLQDLDLSIEKIAETRKNYPGKIASLKEQLEKEREITDLERKKLEELDAERRREERNLEQEIEKIKKSGEKLSAVKTNKEYQAALKEIALAKESNSEKEEKILNILEELDVLRGELGGKEKHFRAICKKVEKESNELEKKLEEFERQLADKTKKREELFPEVDPDMLRRYESIKKGRHGIAVVAAKNGFCQGCNMGMPPQLSIEVQKEEDLVFCPNCNRILYWTNNS